ncbi:HET-domain-containing protein, partial [Cenococcum geophilum 1.58]
ALSYVWGFSSKAVPINLDGFKIPVTQNLEYALRYPRRQTQPRRIWVDAVCINQADLDERSKQVSRMKNIYQQAFNVVIWLGEENEPRVGEVFYTGRNCEAFMVLSKLLYRKWFTRVWVLQELAAASAAGVVCGNASISWSVLEIAFEALRDLFSECVYETLPMLAIPFR